MTGSCARYYSASRGEKESHPLAVADVEYHAFLFSSTGLDHNENVIIEIAVIITDGQLVPVDAGINYIIKTDQDVLDNMNEWCIKQHGVSFLTSCRYSLWFSF